MIRFLSKYFFLMLLVAFLPFQRVMPNAGDVDSNRSVIDSLLHVLPKVSEQEKVEILFSLSRIYLSISLDSSREYARLALNSAKQIKNSQKIAEAYKMLGNIALYKGDLTNVISFYDSSLTEYRLANDTLGMTKVWNNLGIIYNNMGDYHKSIEYHLKSLDSKIRIKDSAGIANSYNNIGSIYLEISEYTLSYEYFQKALALSMKLHQQSTVSGILNNLGMINQEVGDQEKAIEYFNQSLEIGESYENYKGMADAYHNLGKSHFLLGKYKDALEFYQKAIDLYDQVGIDNSNTYNNIGQVYIELDYYNQALLYLREALEIAQENNQIKSLRDIQFNLSVVYDRMGRYKDAFESYKLFNLYDDSLKSKIHSSKIEELLTKNELEKKQEQIKKTQLELDNKEIELRRRNFAIYSVAAGLLGTLIFALIILRLLRLKNKANVLLQEQNDEISRSQKIIKNINKALTENEGKLRSIFDISPYAILVINNDLTILDCNDTSLTMFEAKTKHDLLNKNFENLLRVDSETGTTSHIITGISANKLNKRQVKLNRIDGREFAAEITTRDISDKSDKPSLYIVVITDITERLSFIESLKEAKLRAEESDKLKTAFLANMSHEIRTPMNSIVGFSNLLNDRDLTMEKSQEYVAHILQSSSLLLNLIDDIIDISKIEAGQLNFNIQEFNLNRLVEDLFHSFKETSSNKNVEFRLNLPEEGKDITCKTDPLRLKQVLSNLLSNSIKFTLTGYIELGYMVMGENRKPMVQFFVRDSGIGIPEDKFEMIFERFRQVDDSRTRNYGGTGLGLSISKRLVELMGGRIWVESKPEKGSTFYFTVPYVKTETIAPVESEQALPKYNWKGKTLLIAEDENSNYELLKATLTGTKIKIIRMMNGEEAVDYVTGNNPVDVILMDIRMPKMNGYDATRNIKAHNQRLPVIAITAYAMSEDEAKSIKAGCDMYISKPIKPGRLLEILDGYLGES